MVSVIKVHSDPVEGAYELHVCKSVIRVDFSGENIDERRGYIYSRRVDS